jgi:hypothetical protein
MRRAAYAAAVVLVAAAVAAQAAAAGSTERRAANPFPGVNFVSRCLFSHRAPDDPIVYPGQPGKSHDHSFVGNVSTNASSTLDSLLGAATTCLRPADRAAYWMPTLLDGGTPVAPRGAVVYYRRLTLQPVQPFPAGLKMIAGDAHAVSPQPLRVTFWNCGAAASVRPQSSVPTCPDSGRLGLRLHVRFPNCWDGTNLDSADHTSHMAYSQDGVCPADHPVAVPALEVIFRYPIAGDAGVYLASGGELSAHADFFNAWNEERLTRLVDFCLNGGRHCGAFGGPQPGRGAARPRARLSRR